LDIMLPGLSGLEVLSRARARDIDTPILLLTARDSVADKVQGLDAGADDYLTKPFALEELLARIRMLLRKKAGSKTNSYQLADLILDVTSHRVVRAGQEINLSAREFALLQYLMVNRGQTLSRQQIEDHLWDYSYEGASNMVDVYIRYLRKKIDEGFEPKLIHTVRGVGYVIKEP
ncbi:MAG: response regulator transcription factor, partial [Eubacterium sp.]|nr:response regulator transcription factor [Eubacterium sp.]